MALFLTLTTPGLMACDRQERETTSAATTTARSGTAAVCGNGKVEPGEVCDYGVRYEEGCPDGWEVCWQCDQTCEHFRLHILDEDWGACTQHANGRLYARREYDAHAHNVFVEYDRNYDGEMDAHARAGFDEDGKQLFWERDEDGDGIYERDVVEYDDKGRRSAVLEDLNGDGKPDNRWVYQYDQQGRTTLEQRFNEEALQESVSIEYDEAGRIFSRERDANGDGKANERKRFTYDARDNMTLWEHDTDGDGMFDERVRYTYDSHNNVVREQNELPAHQPSDVRFVIHYDERGNRTKVERYENDEKKPTECWRADYDRKGNLTLREQDNTCDGKRDSREARSYDEDGKVLEVRYQEDGQEQTVTYNYDCVAETLKSAPKRKTRDGS